MTTFSIDTAAAINELERSGVDNGQAAAIVGIIAKADTDHATKVDIDLVKADIDRVRTELKADIDVVRTELKADIDLVKADIELLGSQVQKGFSSLESQLANANVKFAEQRTEQQRHANRQLVALISVVAVATAALAIVL